jgi:hypothetical protein
MTIGLFICCCLAGLPLASACGWKSPSTIAWYGLIAFFGLGPYLFFGFVRMLHTVLGFLGLHS